MGHTMQYFLGGNTADGFCSLYSSFADIENGGFLWILKGGAGCGKSSFMRRLGSAAEAAGLSTEYVVCSGDPDSLDGVYLPALKTGFVDGTAPHSFDAHIAAADSAYIDLGAFYDRTAIAGHRAELETLFAANKQQYRKAYALLGAAGSLQRGWLRELSSAGERERALERIDGAAQREFGKRTKTAGSVRRFFLSANTCNGRAFLSETAEGLCSRRYVLENRASLGGLCLERLAARAASAGHDIILCPDPLTPEVPEAVIIPGLSLGFFCGARRSGDADKNIRLDSLLSSERRREVKLCEKQKTALLSEAYVSLGEAKRLHDEIERIYNPHVDFDGIYALLGRHLELLGLSEAK